MSAKRDQLEEVATEAVARWGYSRLRDRTLAIVVSVKTSTSPDHSSVKTDLAKALIQRCRVTFAELRHTDSFGSAPIKG